MDYWIIQWFYMVISLWCSQGTKSVRLLCTAMMKGVVHRWPWSRWFTFAPPGIAVTSLGRVWKDHRFVYLSYIAVRYQPHHWRGKTHIRNAILTSYNFNHFTLHAPTRQMPHMIPKKNSKTGCREPPPTLLRPIACHLVWKMVICCSSPKHHPGNDKEFHHLSAGGVGRVSHELTALVVLVCWSLEMVGSIITHWYSNLVYSNEHYLDPANTLVHSDLDSTEIVDFPAS